MTDEYDSMTPRQLAEECRNLSIALQAASELSDEYHERIKELEQQEVNWSHPKAQAELSAKARAQLVIKLAEGLIDEGGQEHWSATDFDYEHPLHDKILELLRRIKELEERVVINTGGIAPVDGYYWVYYPTSPKPHWRINTEIRKGYRFDYRTRWVGPIQAPEES